MIFTSKALGAMNENDVEDTINQDIDLDVIEDNIDGNEAYEDEIEKAQDAEFDFDGNADAVTETYAAIYEAEYNWSQIMRTIGLYELNEVTHGRSPILEGVDIKGFFSKAAEMIRRLVEKVANICQQAVMKIKKSNMVRNGLLKNKKEFDAGIKYLQDHPDKGFGKMKSYDGLDSAIKNMRTALNYKYKINDDGTTGPIDAYSNNIEDTADSYRKKFFNNGSGVTADNFRSKLKEEIEGKEVTNRNPSGTLRGMLKNIDDSSNISDIKNLYKIFEREANDTISTLNRLKNQAKKDGGTKKGDDDNSKKMKAYTDKINNYKNIKSIASVAISVMISCMFGYVNQQMRLIRQVTKLGKKGDDYKFKDAKNEGYTGGGNMFDNLELV